MVNGMILVTAEWDPEAGVFVATSDDVPGLVAEAATPTDLDEKLKILIPELLELNGGVAGNQYPDFDLHERHYAEVSLVVRSERATRVRVYA